MAKIDAIRINMEKCRTRIESLCAVILVISRIKIRSAAMHIPTNTMCVVSVRMVESAIQEMTMMQSSTKAQLAVSGSMLRLDQMQRNQTITWSMTQVVRMMRNGTWSIMLCVMVWGGKADTP